LKKSKGLNIKKFECTNLLKYAIIKNRMSNKSRFIKTIEMEKNYQKERRIKL